MDKKLNSNVVSQYPNGFSDNEPLLDDMSGVGSSSGVSDYQDESVDTGAEQNLSNIDLIIAVIAFVILMFFLGGGWFFSVILAFVIGTIADLIRRI